MNYNSGTGHSIYQYKNFCKRPQEKCTWLSCLWESSAFFADQPEAVGRVSCDAMDQWLYLDWLLGPHGEGCHVVPKINDHVLGVFRKEAELRVFGEYAEWNVAFRRNR